MPDQQFFAAAPKVVPPSPPQALYPDATRAPSLPPEQQQFIAIGPTGPKPVPPAPPPPPLITEFNDIEAISTLGLDGFSPKLTRVEVLELARADEDEGDEPPEEKPETLGGVLDEDPFPAPRRGLAERARRTAASCSHDTRCDGRVGEGEYSVGGEGAHRRASRRCRRKPYGECRAIRRDRRTGYRRRSRDRASRNAPTSDDACHANRTTRIPAAAIDGHGARVERIDEPYGRAEEGACVARLARHRRDPGAWRVCRLADASTSPEDAAEALEES